LFLLASLDTFHPPKQRGLGWKVANEARRNNQERQKEKKRKVWEQNTSESFLSTGKSIH